MKKIVCALICVVPTIALAQDFDAGVDAQARNSTCTIHTPCLVATSHWANYINKSGQPKTIYVVYEICPQNENCHHDRYKIVVNPGHWVDSKIEVLEAKYHQRGDFFLQARTTLTDETGKPITEKINRGFTRIR